MKLLTQSTAFLILALLAWPSLARERAHKEEPKSDAVQPQANIKQMNQHGLRYTIQVRKFTDETACQIEFPPWWVGVFGGDPNGQVQQGPILPSALASMMSDALQQSGRFTVIAANDMRDEAMAEQDFANSQNAQQGGKTPQVGKMTPAQLLVRGRIVGIHESGSKNKGINLLGKVNLGGSKTKKEVTLYVELVNSQTGIIEASKTVVGVSETKSSGFKLTGIVNGVDYESENVKSDNLMLACRNAIEQSVDFCLGQLDQVQWTGSVVSVKEDTTITMNRGEQAGVEPGLFFEVGKATALNDPDTGEFLEWEIERVGLLETTGVNPKTARCRIVELEPGKKIEAGYRITPTQNGDKFLSNTSETNTKTQ